MITQKQHGIAKTAAILADSGNHGTTISYLAKSFEFRNLSGMSIQEYIATPEFVAKAKIENAHWVKMANLRTANILAQAQRKEAAKVRAIEMHPN